MTGSKDDLFRDSSPAPAATAESATNISPEKEKNSQVESQDPKTPSSSTPFHSPTDLGGRRSPPSILGASNASRLSNIATPYGANSDHQSLTDDSAVDQIIMKNPTAENIQLMTENLSERIERFGLDFKGTSLSRCKLKFL